MTDSNPLDQDHMFIEPEEYKSLGIIALTDEAHRRFAENACSQLIPLVEAQDEDHYSAIPHDVLDRAITKALFRSIKILKDPVHTSVQDRTVTASVAEYRDPLIDKPPRGVDMNVLTRGGIHIRAQWRDDMGFIAWSPLPSTPQWAKERLNSTYLERSIQNYNEGTKASDEPCPLADPDYPNN